MKTAKAIRGNINALQRWGLNGSCTWELIDNLTYNYGASGYNPKNQLQSVTESSDLTKGFKSVANGSTYIYDTNGNMTADPNKSITNIVYNHLNLPTTITFTNSRSISFMYDAGGNKLRKTVVQNGMTHYIQDYVGGIEYRTTPSVSSTPVLESIFHAEGRITNVNSTLKYEYALKDHLGNTRIMFCDKNGDGKVGASSTQENSEITQENHFYPFGFNMEGTWQNTPSVLDNKYGYNGKEYNDDFGLNWNDYGARMYDPAIGKWNGFDAMAEAYQAMSPYHYAMNNPMRFIDPDGMYSNDGTTSRNTGALATDGSMVGGSSHFESNGQGGNPPTIKEVIKEGTKSSKVFAALLKEAGITLENYSNYIYTGKKTFTDSETGKISLSKSEDISFQIIKLTHELTNRANLKELKKMNSDVAQGKISPKEFAQEYAKSEVEGQINQIKVASEISYKYTGKGSETTNKLIESYTKDNSIDLSKALKSSNDSDYYNAYESLGKSLREQYLREHPKIIFKKAKGKD